MADKCRAKKSTKNGRKGGICANRAMPNGRCRFHGGKSTGPKRYNAGKNALKHGIYERILTEQAAATLSADRLGALDHELSIARHQLAMALEAQAKADGEPEVEEVIERVLIGFGSKKDTISRVRDYAAIIDKRLARIESLEKARMALILKLGTDDPPDMDGKNLTPGEPDEPAPANPIR